MTKKEEAESGLSKATVNFTQFTLCPLLRGLCSSMCVCFKRASIYKDDKEWEIEAPSCTNAMFTGVSK